MSVQQADLNGKSHTSLATFLRGMATLFFLNHPSLLDYFSTVLLQWQPLDSIAPVRDTHSISLVPVSIYCFNRSTK